MNIANDAGHGARHVARGTRRAGRRAADGGLMSTITEATGAKGPAAPTAGALRRDAVGVSHIVFFVLAAAAPLTAVVGASPAAFAFGNGAGVPGTTGKVR